jgi:GST-like protein
MICYPWSLNWQTLGQDLAEFKHVQRWLDDVGSRPAVKRGMEVGKELAVDFSKLSKEELDRRGKILSNQRALRAPG